MAQVGLNRDLAPLSDAAWKRIDAEAIEVLGLHLAARRVMDFDGPRGWEFSAIDLGGVQGLEGAARGRAVLRRRLVRPLLELRVPVCLDRRELELIDRGADHVDLEPLREAARHFAAVEDSILFDGLPEADVPGILAGAEHAAIDLPADLTRFPEAVSEGLAVLRREGVPGPYALVLGPDPHRALLGTAGDGGYPVMRHVERLLDGPVVWAPGLSGGALLSLRGGDFRLVCGRDASLGYWDHDEKEVRLYLEESFTMELNGPEAVVPLRWHGHA